MLPMSRWAVVLSRAAGGLQGMLPGWVAAVYVPYASFWAPVGCGVALARRSAWLGRQRWGRVLAVVHAVLSLPSVVLAPLALFVLDSVRRDRAR